VDLSTPISMNGYVVLDEASRLEAPSSVSRDYLLHRNGEFNSFQSLQMKVNESTFPMDVYLRIVGRSFVR
jgi:hypothetical protein